MRDLPYPVGLPDTPNYPGVHFVLKLPPPPRILSGGFHSNAIISYQEQYMAPPSTIFRMASSSEYYYTSFRSQSGTSKILLSRQELGRAWVIGLNALRFHSQLLYHLTEEWEQPLMDPLSPTARRITWVAVEWHGCFKELDWALGILNKHEDSHYLPSAWLSPGSYDIKDLIGTSSSPRKSNERQPISDLFMYAAFHLLELDRKGYDAEFLALARSVDFDLSEIRHCYVPGMGLPLPPHLPDQLNS